MSRAALALGALALALPLAACGDDDVTATTTTRVTVALGEPLPMGATFEDPTGNATLTIRGVRLTGGLLLADAEACASDTGLPALGILPSAWQLRLEGRDQTIPQVTLDAPTRAGRPPWPDTVVLEAGQCVEGKVAFRVPPQAQPAEVVFTQLSTPASWTIRN